MADDDVSKHETALNLPKSSQSGSEMFSQIYEHLNRMQDSVFSNATLAATAGLALDDSFVKRAMDAQNSSRSKAMAAILDNSFIKKAMDMQRNAFSNATLAATAGFALDDSFVKRAMDAQNSSISKAMTAISKLSHLDDSLIKNALEWPHSSTGRIMDEKVRLPANSESIFLAAIELGRRTAPPKSPDDAKSINSFAEIFKSLPRWSQKVVIWVIVSIFLGAFEDFGKEELLEAINKTKSYLISLTEKKAITKTSIISSNSEIAWDELNNFRTITRENVRLRKSPSMNSEVIEVLNKNRVVAVMETKDRQWLFVQVIIGDEKLQGWVNRSYTKRLDL